MEKYFVHYISDMGLVSYGTTIKQIIFLKEQRIEYIVSQRTNKHMKRNAQHQ